MLSTTEQERDMKAIVYTKYGSPDVLELKDIDKPVVKDDEVLVRVRAASVNPHDWHVMTGLPYLMRLSMGLSPPGEVGLGADLAGVVEAVGRDVTRFRSGDEVFGEVNGEVPGQESLDLGSFAEYVCVSEDWVAGKPASMTFEQAAAAPLAAITALQGLRDYGQVQPGRKVLINGASGGVGTFAVQIAKAFGAEVTGVCSTRNVDMVRSIGADHVIDYTQEDFSADGQQYDLILDNVGNRSLSDFRRVMTPEGMYLGSYGRPEHLWTGPMTQLLMIRVASWFASQKIVFLTQHRKKEDIDVLKELMETGKVAPVIDKTYPLSETPEAMRHLERGRTRGKVVVTVQGAGH
jgi:NADPH:quinone reductase-like Zn-dependent oxidoreductase